MVGWSHCEDDLSKHENTHENAVILYDNSNHDDRANYDDSAKHNSSDDCVHYKHDTSKLTKLMINDDHPKASEFT